MPLGGANSERVLILAPGGRDAAVASKLLEEAGWPTFICRDGATLSDEFDKGAALSVVVEEALSTDELRGLAQRINIQPAWSDFPFLVLTGRGNAPGRNALAVRFQDILGNVTFLERPFHPTTLISLVRSALRSRLRQYEIRELLERQGLLMSELRHRTKNLLAVAQSIASSSLQDTQGREDFFSRLQALSKAQDLIMAGAGSGALMKNVVDSVLGTFEARAIVEGPNVFLDPNTTQSFALVLHELVTNATKHGALTRDTGTVSVRWTIDSRGDEPTIAFQWQERGGPEVLPPKRKGFGTVLLERAITTSGAPPHFDYSPEGFTYEVTTPLAKRRQ